MMERALDSDMNWLSVRVVERVLLELRLWLLRRPRLPVDGQRV